LSVAQLYDEQVLTVPSSDSARLSFAGCGFGIAGNIASSNLIDLSGNTSGALVCTMYDCDLTNPAGNLLNTGNATAAGARFIERPRRCLSEMPLDHPIFPICSTCGFPVFHILPLPRCLVKRCFT